MFLPPQTSSLLAGNRGDCGGKMLDGDRDAGSWLSSCVHVFVRFWVSETKNHVVSVLGLGVGVVLCPAHARIRSDSAWPRRSGSCPAVAVCFWPHSCRGSCTLVYTETVSSPPVSKTVLTAPELPVCCSSPLKPPPPSSFAPRISER